MQPPVKGFVTMGLDPGYRMGCKVAVVDPTGKVLDTTVVYPTHGERGKNEAIDKLAVLIKKHKVAHIAIGNGTASRETEQMAVELIRKAGGGVSYAIVNEAGASVYSASKLAAEEFHRPAAPGPPGGAGEDRPQIHRRGPIPARHAPGQAGRGAGWGGGGLRERGGGGREHRLRAAAHPGGRAERHHGKKYREVPGRQRPIYDPEANFKGAEIGPEGL